MILAVGSHCRSILALGGTRFPISYYNILVEIHVSARKHGVADEDIEHAIDNVMSIDDQDDDTRLYLGSARNADLLEVVTIVRDEGLSW